MKGVQNRLTSAVLRLVVTTWDGLLAAKATRRATASTTFTAVRVTVTSVAAEATGTAALATSFATAFAATSGARGSAFWTCSPLERGRHNLGWQVQVVPKKNHTRRRSVLLAT
jgi:hypothetical protein